MNLITQIRYYYQDLKHNPAEVINNALDQMSSTLEKIHDTVADIYDLFHDPDIQNRPKLSDETYEKYVIYLGERKADEVKYNVESGIQSISDAEELIQKIEMIREHSKNRRDIEPEEWQDFEEGWRPEGWYS